MTTKPAIGYVRVSTRDQAADGVSLAAQRERIAAWCQANGYELADVHMDAVSAKRSDNRPGLQTAIDVVCRSSGVLVVYSLSRLARSTRDTLDIADRLTRADADLVSLTEKIDTTSAAGKMVFRMLAVLAEFERDLIAERTCTALAHKRLNHEKTGGAVPFGYCLADDGVHLVEDEHEQTIVGLIVDLRCDGWTYRAIADELHRRGVAPKTGDTWHAKVIRAIYQRAAA